MSVTTNPTTENCKNIRDYLTPTEVTILIDAVKKKGGWYAYRNATLILIMYRHGLRRSEASHLRWSDIDLVGGTIYIRRVKGSKNGRHPLQGDEIRALKRLRRKNERSLFVFIGNRQTPLSERSISHIVHQAGILAEFDFPVHAHPILLG